MKSFLVLGLALVVGGLTVDQVQARGRTCKSHQVAYARAKAAPAAAAPAKDIVDTAVGAGSFKTLATALTAAGLVDTLKGDGPFTVFAPTDEAFAKLPKGTVEALLKDIPKLQAILKYHVVAGKVMAVDVVKLKSAETVGGQSVKIDASNGVKINDAKVVTADVPASNGVIHVIDTVLIPE
ncbi:MAG: fasciclin domain-containing protein [Planctomycetaceae bacterium]|nr:fasciclin domain-containing protein [Planctomycetaceae bacterium]